MKVPLLTRTERYTRGMVLVVAVAAVAMTAAAFMHGMVLDEVFLLAVALAVSAFPKGFRSR